MIGLIQNKTIYEYDIRSLILAFMLGEKIELTDHVGSIFQKSDETRNLSVIFQSIE